MDREIKFRGRYDYDKTWFYGNLFYPDIKGRAHVATPQKGCYDINPSTIGQFTGLKDENGLEIYEGDILSWHDDSFQDTEFRGRVFYRDAAFWVQTEEWYLGRFYTDDEDEQLLMDVVESDNLVVIGNIYDNPEWFRTFKVYKE